MRQLLQRARLHGITPAYIDRLLDAFAEDRSGIDDKKRERYQLSQRELEILALLSDGLSVAEIAQRLFIQQNTVRQHLKSCYSKLRVHSQAQAISRMRAIGIA
jgi:DNA-binding NarL/FixJ family response regulator